jgi:hypothetical protein
MLGWYSVGGDAIAGLGVIELTPPGDGGSGEGPGVPGPVASPLYIRGAGGARSSLWKGRSNA